jgi:hypothetical protein
LLLACDCQYQFDQRSELKGKRNHYVANYRSAVFSSVPSLGLALGHGNHGLHIFLFIGKTNRKTILVFSSADPNPAVLRLRRQ